MLPLRAVSCLTVVNGAAMSGVGPPRGCAAALLTARLGRSGYGRFDSPARRMQARVAAMAGSARDPAQVPAWVEPMLAKADHGHLPNGPQWAYEYKLDFCARFQPVGFVVQSRGTNPIASTEDPRSWVSDGPLVSAAQISRMFTACGPLVPWPTSNSTRWFSSSMRTPLPLICE